MYIWLMNSYFLDKVCKRPWNFERVPNAMIQGHDRALIFTSTKEACLAACLNEVIQCYVKWLAQPRLWNIIKDNCIFLSTFFQIFSEKLYLPKRRVQLCHITMPIIWLRQKKCKWRLSSYTIDRSTRGWLLWKSLPK